VFSFFALTDEWNVLLFCAEKKNQLVTKKSPKQLNSRKRSSALTRALPITRFVSVTGFVKFVSRLSSGLGA
jgi:hypothetical protein